MEFGEWLRGLLEQRGESMSDFAKLLGVRDATVSRWISGQRRPDVASTQKIARLVGMPAGLLMELAGHEVSETRQSMMLERELERLHAEEDALKSQGRHAQKRLEELQQRIKSVRKAFSRSRWDETASQIMSGLSLPPRWHEESNDPDLSSLDHFIPEPQRLGRQFWEEFRDEWTDGERDAFALGMQLGMRISQHQNLHAGSNESDESED